MPRNQAGDWYEPGWCPQCGLPEDSGGKCLGFCADRAQPVDDDFHEAPGFGPFAWDDEELEPELGVDEEVMHVTGD